MIIDCQYLEMSILRNKKKLKCFGKNIDRKRFYKLKNYDLKFNKLVKKHGHLNHQFITQRIIYLYIINFQLLRSILDKPFTVGVILKVIFC